ncbi:MAG: ABC transporter permease [Bacteroidales bacterium]|nr:ABC transporter permease [Bacteroidales bacterium]
MCNTISVFFRVLHTDYIKYRKSLVVWITVAYPLFASAMVSIIYFGMKNIPDNPVFDFSRGILLVASFFLPFYLVLLVTQVNYVENRNQGWKLLYAQPVHKASYFISKILIILFSVMIAYLLLYLFSLVGLKIVHWRNDAFILDNLHITLSPAFIKLLKVYASASLMLAIQYYLSLRLKNFILPLGIGIAATILPIAIFITLGIAGIIQSQAALSTILRYDPYTLPYSFVFDFAAFTNANHLGNIPSVFIYSSVGLGLLVYILAYTDQVRRNVI